MPDGWWMKHRFDNVNRLATIGVLSTNWLAMVERCFRCKYPAWTEQRRTSLTIQPHSGMYYSPARWRYASHYRRHQLCPAATIAIDRCSVTSQRQFFASGPRLQHHRTNGGCSSSATRQRYPVKSALFGDSFDSQNQHGCKRWQTAPDRCSIDIILGRWNFYSLLTGGCDIHFLDRVQPKTNQ